MIGRNRYNTQLPEYQPAKPAGHSLFSKHYLLGIVFVVMAFLVAVFFIYEAQYGKPTEDNIDAQVCIQVVTPARNTETGIVRDFPTPCDVPEGWEKISDAEYGDNVDGSSYPDDFKTVNDSYEDFGFSFKSPEEYKAYDNFEYAYIFGQWSYKGMTIIICYPPVGCQDRSGSISVVEGDVVNEVVDLYVTKYQYSQKDYDFKDIPAKLLEDARTNWNVLVFKYNGRTYHIEGYSDTTFIGLLDSFKILD
jgi:hypothetical protein